MFVFAWVLLGCSGGKDGGPVVPTDDTAAVDEDRDGWPVGEDCDDTNPTTHPGVVDLAYDGVDQDCAGDDDYDLDKDGHTSVDFGGDDCNDANAALSPSLPETPYDRYDNDCDPTTPDDDVDVDGWLRVEDCDDADAEVHPGALERAFDAVDADCDGSPDASTFGVGPMAYNHPYSPRAVDTPHGVAVAFRADRAIGGPFTDPNPDVAVVYTLAHDHVGGDELTTPVNVVYGSTDVDPLGDLDVALDGSDLVAGLTWLSSVNHYGYLAALPLTWVNGVGWFPGTMSYDQVVYQQFTALDVWVDGGEAWVAASSADAVAYARGGAIVADGGFVNGVTAGVATFRDPGAPTTFVTATGTDCVSWVGDPDLPDPTPVPAARQPWASAPVRGARTRGAELTWWTDGLGLSWTDGSSDATLLATDVVLDGEVTRARDGTLFGLAVVDRGDPALVLVRGPVRGPFEEVSVPVMGDGRMLTPVGATLVVRDDRLFLAVAAFDGSGTPDRDVVAYTVLGR